MFQDISTFPLLIYAASQWREHSQRQSGDDVGRELALLVCHKARTYWLRNDHRHPDYNDDEDCDVPNIYLAVEMSLPRVAEELLKAGEDVDSFGPYGDNLLVTAIKLKDEAMVKLLLAHGADITMARKHHGRDDAFYWAAWTASPLIKLMFDYGSDVDLESSSGAALSAACEQGHQWVVEYLLERCAPVDVFDVENYPALTKASRNGHKEIVKLLIAKGADVNRRYRQHIPVCAAARNGHTEIVAMLIEAGADVNAHDSGALFYALQVGHEHTVAALEARGANKLTLTQLNEALIQACEYEYGRPEPSKKAFELLVHRGADVNAENGSALSNALQCGHEDAVPWLEERGAQVFLAPELQKRS